MMGKDIGIVVTASNAQEAKKSRRYFITGTWWLYRVSG